MKQRFTPPLQLKRLFLSLMLLVALPSFAQSFESGGIYYNLTSNWDNDTQSSYTTAYVSQSPEDARYSGDIVIPSTVEYEGQTYTVTYIGSYAFENCKNLTSVQLPNTITRLEYGAFRYCANLKTINLPESLTTLSGDVFEYCEKLADIIIPNSVAEIGSYAFSGCSSIENLVIPELVTKIENYTFQNCSNLKSIELPTSVTSIGEYAFRNCSSLTTIVIPESVKKIKSETFTGCSSLVSIELPKSLTAIERYAFNGCSSLTSIEIPSTQTEIEEGTFNGCSSLKSISIPTSVTSIGNSAFSSCSSLTSVEIPNSVTSIGNYTFNSCSSLISIEIPNSVTSIGNGAFQSCSSLPSIEIPNSVTSIGESAFSRCSSLTSIEIPSSVTSIGSSAFSNCSSLTSIEIPTSVTSIGSHAFSYCSSLKSIEIPSSVTSIDSYAFSDCNNLNTFIILSNDVTFGENVFAWSYQISYIFAPEGLNCDALNCSNIIRFDPAATTILADGTMLIDGGKTLFFVPNIPSTNEDPNEPTNATYVIPDGVTKIAKDAFCANSQLKELTIPASITEIEANAFINTACERVNFIDWNAWYANVTLGNLYANPYVNGKPYVGGVVMTTPALADDLTEIKDYINYGLEWKDEIELPRGIKRIGAYAFYNNKELYSVILPAGLEEIGESAFEGCKLLENPSFPAGLKKIEDGAYKDCTTLTEITLPEGLTMLGEMTSPEQGYDQWGNMVMTSKGVFEGCTSLEKAVLVADIDYLDDNLFKNCYILDKVYFPLNLKTIGESAFENCITIDEITFPATLETIGARAFKGGANYDNHYEVYGKISKLTIPDAVKTIGENAFSYQSIANLAIGKGVETISPYAFYRNENLKVVTFSEGLKEIGEYAFANYDWRCSYISSVELPSTVTTIGDNAFQNCYISKLVIPDQVENLGSMSCGRPSTLTLGSMIKNIASDAFNFEKLYTIRLKAHMPPALNDAFPLTKDQNDQLTLIVNEGRHDTYNTNARWKQIDRIIEDGQSEVTIYLNGEYPLAEEIKIQGTIMPSSVTKMKVVGPLTETDLRVIKENMVSLTSLDMSEVTNVKNLPASQFAGSLLTDIVLPLNLETIGEYAFHECRLLKLYELPETLKTIGYSAFSGCPNVNITTLPAALETIGEYAFQNSGMREVIAGEALANIGNGAFSDCQLLELVDLGATAITAVPYSAFQGCSELDEVMLPKTVETISSYAFSGTALRNIDFTSEVSAIGENAFSNNRRLVTATLPENLSRVESNIFANCPRLISVSMPMETTNVGVNVLASDKKLANISCSAVEAPNAENGAFNDLRYRYVTLTIPTLSYRKYLSAPQWGKFESIKNTINVSVGAGVNVTNAAEKEYQDMLTEDALEEAQEAAAQESGEMTRTRAERRAAARAASVQNFAAMFDGAQLIPGDEGGANRIFINPQPEVKIVSILFDGEELLPTYDQVSHSVLLPAGKSGALKIVTDAPDPVKVESVTLSETTLALPYGQSKQLTATVNPDNADDKTIKWSSSNPDLVSVDKNGLVTANSNWYSGTATITAKASDGSGVAATCEVTVGNGVSYINLSESNVYINVGDSRQVTAYVGHEDAVNKAIKWESDNTDVATVDQEGNIKAVGEGSAIITVTALDGCGASSNCYVTVYPANVEPTVVYVESIGLSETVVEINVGETRTLVATVNPENATNRNVTWMSDNTGVVTVDGEGNLQAMGAGSATITVSAVDGSGVTATCYVTVKTPNVYVEFINLSEYEPVLVLGETRNLTPSIYPDNATNKSLIWESADPSIVSVDGMGNITAVGVGEVDVTVSSTDGSGVWVVCHVTVYHDASVEGVNSDEVSVAVEGNEIVVNGVAQGTVVALYSADGKVYYSSVSDGSEIRMSVVAGQIYILRAGDITKKIMTR